MASDPTPTLTPTRTRADTNRQPAERTPFTVDALWQVQRLSNLSVSPDGAQAVCAVASHSMDDNSGRTALWLLSTLGGRPRELTRCGAKDGQPRWSPTGELIGFVARREQEGRKDEVPAFYVIPPDGGEARRVAEVPTGIVAWRWFPDGKRIALLSWVWPDLKGARAQAAAMKAERERKDTGYATSEAFYRYWDDNLPQGRVVHLLTLDIASGALRDRFEGTPYEMRRADPDMGCFDISPDGERIAFAYDPAPVKQIDGRSALVELNLRRGTFTTLVQDAGWDLGNPSYAPDGERIAFTASHQAVRHTMPQQLGLWERAGKTWTVPSADWDHEVMAPLRWQVGNAGGDASDADALVFTAEHRGRQPLWRFNLASRSAEALTTEGCVREFDLIGDAFVTLHDSYQHPAQAWVRPLPVAGEPATNPVTPIAPQRLESFNDALLSRHDLGHTEEVWITGAQGDAVQMWVAYPPGFNPRKKYPVLHMIHGGPHTCTGDLWHTRWNMPTFTGQGYVVASVNYHGSTSFGHAFVDAITHRWGALELQDIEAGTDWLLQQRWADPKRVFASGGSYGGFMVAWMNAHVPAGRYAAYVCHAGCFDWTAMFADDAYIWHVKELGAYYWDDPAKVDAQSPRSFAHLMDTPTLVIHGARDYRVPDAQGLAYYHTLKARGVDARLLWFPDENHWVMKPRNSKLWHNELFAWLARHDPKAASPTGAPRA